MANAKDIKVGNKLNVFVYGPSGTKKTSFAATFPKPYIFDFDNGLMTVRGQDIEYDTYGDIPGEPVRAFKDFQNKMLEFHRLNKTGELPYETVVLDSLTTFQECVMREVKATNRSEAKPVSLPEWGLIISTIRKYIYEVTTLGVNIVVTAHEVMIKDDFTSEIRLEPLLYGKDLPGQVPLWFDEAYHAEIKKLGTGTSFEMRTIGDSRKIGKSRLGVLKEIEQDLTYDKIMAKLKEAK